MAQLCANLEIALRSERNSEHYRQITGEALGDGRRLSALVDGILAWARNQQSETDSCTIEGLIACCAENNITSGVDEGACFLVSLPLQNKPPDPAETQDLP